MIKVKDEKGLVRDPSSKAILRVDPTALVEHRRRKQLLHKLHGDSSRVSDLEQQLQQQRTEISALTELVHRLIGTNK